MEFGLHLGTRGAAGSPGALATIARHAESEGFGYLGFSDHLVIATSVDSPYPYTADGRWFAQDSGFCLDQLSVLSYTAAVTGRIRLLTSVMVLPYRPAVLAAKMLATADVLSGGRITVGVGAGWMAEEMALLGSPPYEARGRVAREYMEAFKVLWTEPLPAYAGEFVAFDGLRFEPKPVQRPHPPIWGGGEVRAARRRAGALGDGWYPVCNNPAAPLGTPAAYAAALADVRGAAMAAGRDPDALDAALLGIGYALGREDRPADGKVFSGTAAQIVDDVGGFAEAGVGTLVIAFETDDLSDCLDRISGFAAEVMPAFT